METLRACDIISPSPQGLAGDICYLCVLLKTQKSCDIHSISGILSKLWYWQDVPRYFVPLKSGDYIYVSVLQANL